MKEYVISSKEISALHNARYYLDRAIDVCENTFKNEAPFLVDMNRSIDLLKQVASRLMEEKDKRMDAVMDMASKVAEENGIRRTVWSIYDIDSFDDESNVPAGSTIATQYSDCSVVTKGSTWLDLWKAVELIAENTDQGLGDHCYIEKFVECKDRPKTFEVWLGS